MRRYLKSRDTKALTRRLTLDAIRCSELTLDVSYLFFEALDRTSPMRASIVGDGAGIALYTEQLCMDDADSFRDSYWATESWRKFPFQLEGVDREESAYQAFFEAETLCRIANERLTDYFARPRPDKYRRWMKEARRRLHWLLGGITPKEVMQRSGWGPGASVEMPRHRASRQHKWQFASHISKSALPWLQDLWGNTPWPDREIHLVEENRVTTVPKNAKTDRVIAIEPGWSMFFQKGVGACIRKRLQDKVGLLRADAQETNKSLASVGSRDGSYVTIDLKGASDSVSLALCELLLPSDLLKILGTLRSERGLVAGKNITYEKVSSMGNGFTFELETALFWALSSSISGNSWSYGDDIIVPSQHGPDVVDFLREAGFVVNEAKTHLSGPFRESCGGHYFNGVDVTPPYFDDPINTIPRCIAVANRLRHCCRRNGYLDGRFEELWNLLSQSVPRKYWGPSSAGDVCLHSSFDSVRPDFDLHRQCYFGAGIVSKRILSRAPAWGALQASLHGDSYVERFPTKESTFQGSIWFSYPWLDADPWL